MKKLSIVLIIALFIGLPAACAPTAETPPTDEAMVDETVKKETVVEEAAAEEPAEAEAAAESAEASAKNPDDIRIACIFDTTIKDGGYAEAAYGALMEMQEEYGFEVSYQESVSEAAVKDVLRNYAAEEYDLVIAHEMYFTEAVNEVAAEFPDIIFAVSGGYEANHPNVVAVDCTNWEATYLVGTLAGLMTETNKLGIVTVSESPIAKRIVNAYKLAAQAQNPDVEVTHVFTGSFDDVVKGKELATALIKDGVDVVYSNCGNGNVGVMEAAAEGGVYGIGALVDMNEVAPDAVITSSIQSPGQYIKIIINGFMDGSLEWGKSYRLGVAEGIEDIAPYHNFDDKIPQEYKDIVEQVKQDLIDGKIDEPPSE